MQTIQRIFIIVVLAALLAVGNNLVNPNKVPWVGNWPTFSGEEDSLWTSPSYDKGDPPTLRPQEAFERFISQGYIFIDAREAEEYQSGHIKGAINLPFETFDDHWAQVEPQLPKDAHIVTYCSGTECDASLMLARLLTQKYGYKNVEIFFGGWQVWDKRKLPIDGKYDEAAN
jgi:rhodanese-related sulfurtransferase